MLGITPLLRASALVFNVLQARLFARLSKDIAHRIRVRRSSASSALPWRERALAAVRSRPIWSPIWRPSTNSSVTPSAVCWWRCYRSSAQRRSWSDALAAGAADPAFNPLVIYATVQLGKRVKHLKKLENDSTSRFTQALTETLDAIQEVRAGNRQGFFLGRLGLRAGGPRLRRRFAMEDRRLQPRQRSAVPVRHRRVPCRGDADRAVFRPVDRPDARGIQLPVVHDRPGGATAEPAVRVRAAGRGRINQLLARADEPQYVGGRNPFADQATVAIDVRDLRFAYQDEAVLEG